MRAGSSGLSSVIVATALVACGGLVVSSETNEDKGIPGLQFVDSGAESGAAGNHVDGGQSTPKDGGATKDAGSDVDASSQTGPGWSCTGTPPVCVTICGDGIVAGNETCDDDTTCPGSCRWSNRYGTTGTQLISSLAVDSTGASIITGYYRGNLDFGGGPFASSGTSNIFIAKIDTAGQHVFSRRAGGTGDDRGVAVATDAAGNVFVTGMFSDTIDLGGGPLVSQGTWDVFLAAFDAAGNHLWSKRFGDTAQQQPAGIALDSSGNILLAGTFWGTLDFGGGAIKSTGSGPDIFVAKLDATGNGIWSRRYGDGGEQGARGIAVDASGNVFVGAYGAGPIDFGGGTLAAIGDKDGFLFSLDGAGAYRWGKRWGRGNGYSGATGVTVDPDGNVIMVGYQQGPEDLGTGPLPSKGALDVIVGKFATTGTPIFAHAYGSSNNDMPYSVSSDAAGNILLTGYAEGAVDFGAGALPHVGGRNAFLTKLDASGALLSASLVGTSATGVGIARAPTGDVIAAGSFAGSIVLSGLTLTSVGQSDGIFLAKLAP